MAASTADDGEKQDLKLELAEKIFLYKTPGLVNVNREAIKQEILDTISKEDLAPIYTHVCTQLGWSQDASLLSKMQAANAAKLEALDAKIKDAEESLGEIDVRDAYHAKADFLCSIGDKQAAIDAYVETEKRTAGAGNKVDLVFSQMRLNILYSDWHAVKANLKAAQLLCDEGGDWERKNKLKVYQGVFSMYARDFKKAAQMFLDSIATFTASEIFPYRKCIFYAVITSMIALDRVALKKQVVDAPEILSVIHHIPSLADFLNSLYFCKYREFFQAFVPVMEQVRADMYLSAHIRHYQREIRVLAYGQFLESYKSVTLASMAAAFDVSVPFLDAEIADFIVAGQLNAQIDKVAGVIETKRPDTKNAFYQDSIKRGDLLLNRIQKLSKVIDVE
jgi:26S proteasome regulatory subunit N7